MLDSENRLPFDQTASESIVVKSDWLAADRQWWFFLKTRFSLRSSHHPGRGNLAPLSKRDAIAKTSRSTLLSEIAAGVRVIPPDKGLGRCGTKSAEDYRRKAEEMKNRAEAAPDHAARNSYANLARGWQEMVIFAERNGR